MLIADYDRSRVARLFAKLEFKSLIEKLPPAASQKGLFIKEPERGKKRDYHLIKTKSDLARLKKKIRVKNRVVIDIETDT